MKETRTINLNGIAFTIDYDAYQSLRDYLHDIELRLSMDERSDVMSDIEARMGELFSKALFAKHIQVIDMGIVKDVEARIGAPAEFGENKRPRVKNSKSENSGCWRIFGITVLVLLAVMALPILLPILGGFIALIAGLFGASVGIISTVPLVGIELYGGSTWMLVLLVTFGLLAVALPIVMIIYTIVSYMRTRRGPKARFWWIALVLWLLSIVGTGTMLVKAVQMGMDIPALLQAIDEYDDDNPMFSESREVATFDGLDVTGAAEVRIHIAPVQSLTVLSNNLSVVNTEVRDGVLYVDAPQVRYAAIKLDVTVPELKSIRVTGACEVKSDDVLRQSVLDINSAGTAELDFAMSVDTLRVTVDGATEIDLRGTAKDATIALNGAGEIDAYKLVAQNMHINCAGASKAEINVQSELWAQAMGASKIAYRGTPSIKQKMEVGGGKIVAD